MIALNRSLSLTAHCSPSDHYPCSPTPLLPPTLHTFRQLHSIDTDSFLTDLKSSLFRTNPPKSPDCLQYHALCPLCSTDMLPRLRNSPNISFHPACGLLLLYMFFDPLSALLRISGNTRILLLTGLPSHHSAINTTSSS